MNDFPTHRSKTCKRRHHFDGKFGVDVYTFPGGTARLVFSLRSGRDGKKYVAPRLLDEVHFLMEKHGYKKFAMSGSSARKLKRGAPNLLARRAAFRAGVAAAEAFIVYRGNRELQLDGIRVLPLETFLRRLHAGEIVG